MIIGLSEAQALMNGTMSLSVNSVFDAAALTRVRTQNMGDIALRVGPQFFILLARLAEEAFRNTSGKLNITAVISPADKKQKGAMEDELSLRKKNKDNLHAKAKKIGEKAPQLWGALSDIEFNLSASPDTLSGTDGVNYASHAIIGGKPRLQYTGAKLQTAKMAINWHYMTTPDLQERFEKLLQAMRDRKVLELTVGKSTEGSAYAGQYVITNISHSVIKHNPDGSIMALNLTVDLQEWVDAPDMTETGKAPKGIQGTGTAATAQVEPAPTFYFDEEGFFRDALTGERFYK